MISRYDPFREALSLRRAMDQLFEQSFVHPNLMPGSSTLMAPMDVCETKNGYEVDVALPGVRPEDIELTVGSPQFYRAASWASRSATRRY